MAEGGSGKLAGVAEASGFTGAVAAAGACMASGLALASGLAMAVWASVANSIHFPRFPRPLFMAVLWELMAAFCIRVPR